MPHSPAPWTVIKGNGLLFIKGHRAPGMAYNLEVGGEDYTGYGEDEQREVDLRLMACAPEMLDVLQRVLLEIEHGAGFEDLTEEIRVILAKVDTPVPATTKRVDDPYKRLFRIDPELEV